MNLYLIRHAHAVTAEEDPVRPLSERGRRQVAQLVNYFRRSGDLAPEVFWHSPLARSRETAALLAAGLGLAAPLVEQPGLEPDDNPADLVKPLARATRDVAIVGHEPHLGALAALLLHGPQAGVPLVFKKGMVLALEGQPKPWLVRWQISPDFLEPAGERT